MGLLNWLRDALAPRGLTRIPDIRARPLWEQFQRIGGGLTPLDVSEILRRADGGQPYRLIDLWNESRQKDGHLQGICSTRDQAVALIDLDFVEPKDATRKEKKATELCRRITDDFRNWPTLIEHLTSAYVPGHATSLVRWDKTGDGLLLPAEATTVHARDFFFRQEDGGLRYGKRIGDTVGVDLLADNPGRVVQVQRRIVGDVPAREGLIRVLVWSALFRNWNLRDWMALGEIGWKPWRIAQYERNATPQDIDDLVAALELVGSKGVAAIPKNAQLQVEWPKGTGSGTAAPSVHRELFDTLGREQSKAVLGQTTTTEPGPNGDRASTETRDQVRKDYLEADCRAVAAALRYHLFMPAVAVNIGSDVRVAAAVFQTEEGADQKDFSIAVKNLRDAGLRIPAAWVRDTMQMPEPTSTDEILELAQAPTPGGNPNAEDPQQQQPAAA